VQELQSDLDRLIKIEIDIGETNNCWESWITDCVFDKPGDQLYRVQWKVDHFQAREDLVLAVRHRACVFFDAAQTENIVDEDVFGARAGQTFERIEQPKRFT